MSTNPGIFESFPNQPATRMDSPFAVAQEPAAASPFVAAARQFSPFTLGDETRDSQPFEQEHSIRLLDRRTAESPFQIAEPMEAFGFEAPAKAYSEAPFAVPAAPVPAVISPFLVAPQQAVASPFAADLQRGPLPLMQAAQAPLDASQSDFFSIRQIELRAIFGVDREMNPEEILQRARALPGMRNIARLSPQDIRALDALKQLLPNLGFGGGELKLYSGSVPLEFIREGSVILAVQTDGGFAPGVRETLILVARELGRIS
jgi:hypothetical protein